MAFAETDFNVQQILLRLKKLMEICKDPLDTMVIYFSANQSQNVSLRTDKSDSPLIRKSLAEIFRPKVPKATPTVTTAEQQYVQWLIQKGEKPSEAQAAFFHDGKSHQPASNICQATFLSDKRC